MKKLSMLTLATMGIVHSLATAQQSSTLERLKQRLAQQSSITNQIISLQSGAQAASGGTPLATERRIKMQEFESSDGLSMFVTYGYAGNYGSAYNHNLTLEIPFSINVLDVNSPVFDYNSENSLLMSRLRMPFVGGYNLLADTVKMYYDLMAPPTSSSIPDEENYAVRLTNTAVASLVQIDNSMPETNKTEVVYANNMPVEIKTFSYDTALNQFVGTSTRKISYNSAYNKVLTDSIVDLTGNYPSNTLSYYYSATQQLDSIASDDGAMFYFDYYPDKRLRKTTTSVIYPGVFEFHLIDSLGYSATGFVNLREQAQYLSYDTTNEVSKMMYTKTFNGAMADSIKIYTNSDLTTGDPTPNYNLLGKGKYRYGSAGSNPDSIRLFIYDNATTGSDNYLRFTYEDFNTTSIKKLAKNTSFSVYPNPFENTLVFDCKALSNKNVTVVITNLAGQKVMSINQNMHVGKNVVTLYSSLPTGPYVVNLYADNGVFTQKVIKK